MNWEKINKIRKENKDNPNYPTIYWSVPDSKLLYVKIGKIEKKDITVSEAIELFKDNKLFMNELEYLLESKDAIEVEASSFQAETPNLVKERSIALEEIKIEIDTKLDEIIHELGLEKTNDVIKQLKNCCLVQKYIVEHNTYNSNIMNEKDRYSEEEIAILDLYNAVVLNESVCTSNSLMFKAILQKIGIKAEVIGLTSNESGVMHASNIVELNDKYYFFDTTLEQAIYMENKDKTNGQIMLCCAGLGKKEYCKFYTPEVVLPDNPTDNVIKLPENISNDRIPQELVNSLIIDSKKSKH